MPTYGETQKPAGVDKSPAKKPLGRRDNGFQSIKYRNYVYVQTMFRIKVTQCLMLISDVDSHGLKDICS